MAFNRDDLVLSTSRMKFCVVSIEAKVSLRGFLTAYCKSIMLTVAPFYVRLRTISKLSEHSAVKIVVAPLVSLHCCQLLCSSHAGVLVPVLV